MLDMNSSLKEICDEVWDKNNPEEVRMKEQWFMHPSSLYGGKSAVEMLKSPKGARRVKQVILAGMYGVFL
jgi:hypothetical protein